MTRDLQRRLGRLEAASVPKDNPTRIFADRPMTDEEGAAALANWRELVASGEAQRNGCVLCILSPAMIEEEWATEIASRG